MQRFPDARLAGEEHHLAFTSLGPRPTPKQQFQFFFAPDKGSQAAAVQRLKTAFRRTRAKRRPGPHRRGDALEVLCPKVLQFEQIA